MLVLKKSGLKKLIDSMFSPLSQLAFPTEEVTVPEFQLKDIQI